MNGRTLAAVAVGAAAGGALRLTIDTLLPHGEADLPVSTLIINVAGSFLLAVLVARVWPTAAPWLRAGLGAGFAGTFTTFSAFAVSLVTLGPSWTAVLYLVLTLVLGLGAALLGLRLGAGRRPIEVTE